MSLMELSWQAAADGCGKTHRFRGAKLQWAPSDRSNQSRSSRQAAVPARKDPPPAERSVADAAVESTSRDHGRGRRRTASLRDLAPADKKRVANLIQELARLGQEKERISAELLAERQQFERTRQQLTEEQQRLLAERQSVQQELSQCQAMLLRFQQDVVQKLELTSASSMSVASSTVGASSSTAASLLRGGGNPPSSIESSDDEGSLKAFQAAANESSSGYLSKTLDDYIDRFDRTGGHRSLNIQQPSTSVAAPAVAGNKPREATGKHARIIRKGTPPAPAVGRGRDDTARQTADTTSTAADVGVSSGWRQRRHVSTVASSEAGYRPSRTPLQQQQLQHTISAAYCLDAPSRYHHQHDGTGAAGLMSSPMLHGKGHGDGTVSDVDGAAVAHEPHHDCQASPSSYTAVLRGSRNEPRCVGSTAGPTGLPQPAVWPQAVAVSGMTAAAAAASSVPLQRCRQPPSDMLRAAPTRLLNRCNCGSMPVQDDRQQEPQRFIGHPACCTANWCSSCYLGSGGCRTCYHVGCDPPCNLPTEASGRSGSLSRASQLMNTPVQTEQVQQPFNDAPMTALPHSFSQQHVRGDRDLAASSSMLASPPDVGPKDDLDVTESQLLEDIFFLK